MICIIPARKNSKGLKLKNRKKINKLSLVNNALKSALKSKEIKSIMLTTDDDYLIKNSIKSKKIIINKRPARLALDTSSALNVYFYCLKKYEKNLSKKTSFCVFLPTSPFRNINLIDKAIKLFKKKSLNFLISVERTRPIEFTFKKDKRNFMQKIKGVKWSTKNRQKLQNCFQPNGNLYVFNYLKLKKLKTFMTEETYCYEMEKKYSFDIDNKEDFDLARKLSK